MRAGALGVVVARLVRRPAPALRRERPSRAHPTSVVIPARNEAANISTAVESALGAAGVERVIVVDDGSSDGTAAKATDAGATVVAAGPRPPGWAGKTWAVQVGVETVRTGWVITLDADTTIEPMLGQVIVERALAEGTALLSVAPHFDRGSAAGTWLHASMLTTLVYRYGRPGSARSALVSGQCLAFDAERFLGWGGYGPVAGSVVEDVALSRWLAKRGERVSFADGAGMLRVQQYPGFAATWLGWGRSLGLATVEPIARRVFDIGVLSLAMLWPLVRIGGRRGDPLDLIALGLRVGTLIGTAGVYRSRPGSYWLSPVADVLSIGALQHSLLVRHQRWRGRLYPNR